MSPSTSRWHKFVHFAYGGVNNSLSGNGGFDCAGYLHTKQRVLETLTITCIGLLELYIGFRRCSLPKKVPPTERTVDRKGKRFLLVLHCMTFGIEIGFKFATKQLIYTLNPCHILTAIQLTHVNLNNMLCPAISDPFHGPYYRVWACLHQSALTLLQGKVYTVITQKCLGPRKLTSAENVAWCWHCEQRVDTHAQQNGNGKTMRNIDDSNERHDHND